MGLDLQMQFGEFCDRSLLFSFSSPLPNRMPGALSSCFGEYSIEDAFDHVTFPYRLEKLRIYFLLFDETNLSVQNNTQLRIFRRIFLHIIPRAILILICR